MVVGGSVVDAVDDGRVVAPDTEVVTDVVVVVVTSTQAMMPTVTYKQSIEELKLKFL